MEKQNILHKFWLLVVIFEFACLYLFLKGFINSYSPNTIFLIISFHLLSAITASICTFLRDDELRTIYPFVFLFILTVPVFGLIGILNIFNKSLTQKPTNLYEEYRQYILSGFKGGETPQKLKKSYLYLRRDYKLEPISDIVEHNEDIEMKKALIRNFARNSPFRAISILKGLLNDPSLDVRFWAGEEISKIEDTYNSFINEYKKKISEDPSNYTFYMDLGRLYSEYAISALVRELDKKNEIIDACLYLEESIRINPNQYESHYLLGENYLFLGEFDKALGSYDKATNVKIDDIPSLIGISKCAWEKRDIDLLEKTLDKAKFKLEDYTGDDKRQFQEFLRFWENENG